MELLGAFASGLGMVFLPFPLTYIVMSKRNKIKMPNVKIITLLLISAMIMGVVHDIILKGIITDNILWVFLQGIGIPTFISAAVINVAYKRSFKE
jgi:hypothetical protein